MLFSWLKLYITNVKSNKNYELSRVLCPKVQMGG